MSVLKEIINDFLNNFCIKVPENEDPATTELYMDDHKCIEYENQLYYIPDNNSCYEEDDEFIRGGLLNIYGL